MAIINFSAKQYVGQGEGADLLESALELAKQTISGKKEDSYQERNKFLNKKMLDYACKVGNVDQGLYDMTNKQDFGSVLEGNPQFQFALFSVVQKAIETVNSKTELNQAIQFMEFLSIAEGDSINQKQVADTIVDFKSVGYSNNTHEFTYRFDDNRTLNPTPKEASIAMDLYQMTAYGFDWGRFIADISLGQRVAMQKEGIKAMMNENDLLSSAFHLSSFDKQQYIELVELLQAYNNKGIIAYGTKSAWAKTSDQLNQKFLYGTIGDEIVKTGMVQDMFNVPSVILDNAISKDGNFTLQVPSNKIILAPSGDRPVKCLMEGSVKITSDDGKTNSIGLKNYAVNTSWNTKTMYNGATGIVTLS